jgi:hypothetical protein
MLPEYHVIYSGRYYPRLHISVVGLGTYYQWIRGHYCIAAVILSLGPRWRLVVNCKLRMFYLQGERSQYQVGPGAGQDVSEDRHLSCSCLVSNHDPQLCVP